MPEILVFYLSSLAACVAVAIVFYVTIGGSLGALAQQVLGPRNGALWGRSSRILMCLAVMVGGLSTQWYGCGGYADYKEIAADRRRMFQTGTVQVASAISYGRSFVLLAAGVGAITVALLRRRPDDRGAADKAVPRGSQSTKPGDSQGPPREP